MNDDTARTAETVERLERDAREAFGDERAAELRGALTQMAAELQALRDYPVGFDDEP